MSQNHNRINPNGEAARHAGQTCGSCKYWHEKPTEAPPPVPHGAVDLQERAALSAPVERRGICRRFPPTTTSLPVRDRMGNQIGLSMQSSYPDLPATFDACGEYAVRVALSMVEE